MSGVCKCQPKVSVSTQTSQKSDGREGREGESNNKHKSAIFFFPFSPLLEPPPLPSPSVSEKLRVPPPANKAIRDGKDADTAAFEHHSEQKRKRVE